MAASMTLDRPPKGQMKGWHALLWFLGFFGFMFVVNGIFLWAAISSFPGEDVEKSYLAGVDYNHELARRAAQQDAGWTGEIGITQGAAGKEVHARLLKADGSALPVFATTALLRHPTDRALDRVVDLSPAGGGEYRAEMGDLTPGLWTVVVTADVDPQTEGTEFEARREIMVP
ncbi:FixH family protein [Hyphomonas sp. WL0036]|uniref:FixH family protein n=1 Tax=Hyphomonas sediminis TaxID=2866160 RepID=UPI001C81EAC9|nr:FixH family protein [Hyphomonas sediminis]MBY9067196.1 FixH family protein [Hyphomonas sediminis]